MFYISTLRDLKDELERAKGSSAQIIVTLTSPPGTDEWYAVIGTIVPDSPTASRRNGNGVDTTPVGAIEKALEDLKMQKGGE
jgi:hypothetical protein